MLRSALRPFASLTAVQLKNIACRYEKKKLHGNWRTRIESVREKTFTHSCTYRHRHVAACRKPREWHWLLWDKAKLPPLLGSGYEACFGWCDGLCCQAGTLSSFSMPGRPETPHMTLSFHENHACSSTLFLFGGLPLSTTACVQQIFGFFSSCGYRRDYRIFKFREGGLCWEILLTNEETDLFSLIFQEKKKTHYVVFTSNSRWSCSSVRWK